MEMYIRQIKKELRNLADSDYRAFQQKLLPWVEGILGVRVPELRKLAKKIVKGDARAYLDSARFDSYEEDMLYGMVLGNADLPAEEIFDYLLEYIPKINNWGVCDIVIGDLKILGKNKARTWDFLQPFIASDKEFELRFAIVALMEYFMDAKYLPQLFELFNNVQHEGYYVKMAVAWAVSMAFVRFPQDTMAYLKDNRLDDDTYNKALQKITESRQVEAKTKDLIRSMKRQKK